MIQDELEEIISLIEQGDIEDESLRTKLSDLRETMRVRKLKLKLSSAQQREMVKLLSASDAKTRKNLVLLLGELRADESIDAIFKAYVREDRRFVKSAYLTAMGQMDYRAYVTYFKEEEAKLLQMELTIENQKHVQEQLRILSKLILDVEGSKKHTFTGYHVESTMLLMTNRHHVDKTLEQVDSAIQAKSFRSGVMATTDNLHAILPIRTYREILFRVDGLGVLRGEPEELAHQIVNSKLLQFLKERHDGAPPFYYRIELKSKMAADKRSDLLKKLIAHIGIESKRELCNSASHYEFELRMIESQDGGYHTLIKLHTLEDERFTYRREMIAASLKPVDAALLVALAKPYMAKDARVLDPFCGVGTMLIERQFQVKANTSYGIDRMSETIIKARANTEHANQIIHYVNKDFFDFTHEYQFDEIFTNMPFAMKSITQESITGVYHRFFQKVRSVLTNDATIIMYTRDKELVIKLAQEYGFKIEAHIPVFTKQQTDLMVLR